MSKKWKLGGYEFSINPNKYGEKIKIVGDTAISLDGTVISQPTSISTTYNMSSVFFQHRPRINSEVNLGEYVGIEYAGGFLYTLDNTNNTIKKYSKNLSSIEESKQLLDNDYICFDIDYQNNIAWVVDVYSEIHGISMDGSVSDVHYATSVVGSIVGIKLLGGFVWVVTRSSLLYKLNKDNMSIISGVDLPNIEYIDVGYRGMTAEDNFLIITFNNKEHSGVYYIDSDNGNIVNTFFISKDVKFYDVSYDGRFFVFMKYEEDKILYINGNTVLLDLYIFEREIKKKGFLDFKDDMGVTKRVVVDDYSISRMEGNLNKYKVNISATKVDRGVM